MKISFVTFADGRYKPTLARIRAEAISMNLFDSIFIWSEDNFDNEYANKFFSQKRDKAIGFGYWCWKSWAIKNALDKIGFGEYLIYCDAGCSLQAQAANVLLEYCNNLEGELDIIAFQQSWLEKQYDTEDIFDAFDIKKDSPVRNLEQFFAGTIILKKTLQSCDLIESWYQFCNDNYVVLSNENPVKANDEEFISSRYDQSVLSLLLHSYNGKVVYDINNLLPSFDDKDRLKPILVAHKKKYTFVQSLKDFPIRCINALGKMFLKKQIILRKK